MKGYLRYETLNGKGERPPKDSEPTAEQVSSLLHLINQGHPPYADFAIFGPYGHRLYKKIKLSGVTIGRVGTLKSVELHGPANIGLWLQSYQVLVNTLVMLDTVDLGTLLKYKEKIEKFHDRYGENIWAIVYQADVRCRLELMERTKRQLAAAHEAAPSSGGATQYDPNRPWNMVWQSVIADEAFWRVEVIEPGMLILTKVANAGEMLEGDARVQSSAAGAGPCEVDCQRLHRVLPAYIPGIQIALGDIIELRVASTSATELDTHCVKPTMLAPAMRLLKAHGVSANGTQCINVIVVLVVIRV